MDINGDFDQEWAKAAFFTLAAWLEGREPIEETLTLINKRENIREKSNPLPQNQKESHPQ